MWKGNIEMVESLSETCQFSFSLSAFSSLGWLIGWLHRNLHRVSKKDKEWLHVQKFIFFFFFLAFLKLNDYNAV